jgi:hypothetical protein
MTAHRQFNYTPQQNVEFDSLADEINRKPTSSGTKGDKGDKGDTGATGTTGPAGATGAPGPTYTAQTSGGLTVSSTVLAMNLSNMSSSSADQVDGNYLLSLSRVTGQPVAFTGNVQQALAADAAMYASTAGDAATADVATNVPANGVNEGIAFGVMVFDGSGNGAILAPGTDGQVLTTHGPGTAPTWE